MKFIYVASPYTMGDVAVNVRENILAADRLAEAGYVPFVPLLSHFWHIVAPKPYEFWCQHDANWLERCDALVRLPGASVGADKEIQIARGLGIPVYYGLDEFLSRDTSLSNGVPRRVRVDLLTPAELAIRHAILKVEQAGCDPLLTKAVIQLVEAKNHVADFIDRSRTVDR